MKKRVTQTKGVCYSVKERFITYCLEKDSDIDFYLVAIESWLGLLLTNLLSEVAKVLYLLPTEGGEEGQLNFILVIIVFGYTEVVLNERLLNGLGVFIVVSRIVVRMKSAKRVDFGLLSVATIS